MITEIQQITESNPGGTNSNPALIRAGLLLAPPGAHSYLLSFLISRFSCL